MEKASGGPLPRAALAALRAAMAVFPVVVVSGARQTGKSTLVQDAPELAGRPYLSLDDLGVRAQAQERPDLLVGRAEALVLDEVQRAPDLLIAVKAAVDGDRPRRRGRFVLTGSANLLMMERVSESLAGRAGYVTLWPFTRRERRGLGTTGAWSELFATPAGEWDVMLRASDAPAEDWTLASAAGGLPVPAHELATAEARALWFDGYVQTYLERDLQTLANIESLTDFHRLLRAAALRIGSVLNQADIARDVGVPRATAHRWFNLLETSYQIIRVPAFSANRGRRLVKSPKLYWGDVGLGRHLAGGPATGAHLENLVLNDLVAWRELVPRRPDVMHWRTANGAEVDFVIESEGRLLAVEVKATTRPGYDDVRHLVAFSDEYGDAVVGGLLLHGGTETTHLAPGIVAAPWWRVL